MLTTAESYSAIVSQRVTAESLTLAGQWLGRLKELLTVDLNDVFPSDQLLDHIPLLIADVAAYLRAPADEEIAANAAVIAKARELGLLRHAVILMPLSPAGRFRGISRPFSPIKP